MLRLEWKTPPLLLKRFGSKTIRLVAVVFGLWTLGEGISRAQVYEKVFSFTDARAEDPNASRKGINPVAGLVQGSDGNFYGTTAYGGLNDNGTVFRMTAGGVLSTLVEFTGNGASNRGSAPGARLVRGRDGNFYGTTSRGGANDFGTVFKMTAGGVLSTLVEFTFNGASNKGNGPGGLIQGSDGNFYGVTGGGGANGFGTVFRMTAGGVLSTLVNFTGNGASNKGRGPADNLVQGNDGNFYGTTSSGGANDLGTVFKMTAGGVLSTLVEFTGNGVSNKGSFPTAGLVQGSDGNFYGVTGQGGANGSGTVFRMTAGGGLSTLVDFGVPGTGASNNGTYPAGGLVQGSDGNFYGMTSLGGGVSSNGTVFKMTADGVLSTVVDFAIRTIGPDSYGVSPAGRLVQASDGNFYGVTLGGGASNHGTIFKIAAGGVLSTLVDFAGSAARNKGRNPLAGLVQGTDGNFYGTTELGGASDLGTVFKMTPGGITSTLVEFTGNTGSNKGSLPRAGLVQGSDGSFYGTTARGGGVNSAGGVNNHGTVFKMTADGVLTTLVEFTGKEGSNKGTFPYGELVQGSDGNFYGTTVLGGGVNEHGTVFKMTPAGVLSTLVEFTDDAATNRGKEPRAGLVQGSDGNFYGTTGVGGTIGNGTVFKITAGGVLSTLVNFTGNGASNKGSYPSAALVRGSDGNFYGTTSGGGANDHGTVFKMTAGGVLSTLVEFTGNGASNKGSGPIGALVQGSDGNFYGTTSGGGANNFGTVFKMTTGGVLTTLVECEFPDAIPSATLIEATDGGLYGTVSGPDGAIYRLIFAGAPTVLFTNLMPQGSASAVVEVQANARGANTNVSLEYGTDGATFPTTVPLVVGLSGFQTKLVGTTLTGLSPGTTYSYRFRAVSSAGVTVSPIRSFATLAEPLASTAPASQVGPNSARFNGMINARSFDTTAVFEWGTDGNIFPNSVPTVPGTVTGNTDVPMSASVAGLTKGQMYYYRIVATNAGGTTVSGVRSFTTPTEAVVSVGAAFALTTTSARVSGAVRARGSAAQVFFDYGTNGVDFPSSVAAAPGTVTGDEETPVVATLNNLNSGTTYRFRVRAVSAGGEAVSATGEFSLAVLSGFNQTPPTVLDPRPGAQGFLVVNLSPAGIGSAWRFVGEQQWRAPGVPLGGLATGNRQIEFRPVPGFLHPLREPVSVVSGAAATVVEREYFASGEPANGALSVTLLPTPLAGAQWRLLGDDAAPWQNSGATLSNLPAGAYLVECKEVTGYAIPQPVSVTVTRGATKTASVTYFLADAPVGIPATVVGFDAITAGGPNPYTFVGQLRSESGAGSGFVVRKRVVATAAHVVFDDGALSAATGLQWLFQRERGTYEPVPQIPRGSYLLAGYASQRMADGTPGASSAAAQNLDVAAVWFFEEDAARGGSAGYLASDALDNEWLLSDRLKTLVGYPLDDIPAANQGRMHATPPANVTFAHASGRTYLTTDITSRGGNSGGPVCVRYDDGNYLPAAVYLGGTTQTRVRVIDSDVIDLFDSAEESGNTGQNSTNGGVPQGNNPAGSTPSATLTVMLEPAAARTAGAGWRIGSGAFVASGNSKPFLSPGTYAVSFKAIDGFLTPNPRNVTIEAGTGNPLVVTYPAVQPPEIVGPQVVRIARGVEKTFTIQATNQPTHFAVTGLAGTGLTLIDLTTGEISGTPMVNGTYPLNVTAQNGAGSSAPFTITVIVTDPGRLVVQADPLRGSVTVKPKLTGNEIPQGTPIILMAKAKSPGFLFAGWELTGATTTSDLAAAILSFEMSESVSAVANFVTNPFPNFADSYTGRIGPATGAVLSNTGALSLKVTPLGQITGKLLLGAKSYPVKGPFRPDGTASAIVIKRKGLGDLVLNLTLELTIGGSERITGTLTDGLTVLPVSIDRAVYDGKTNPVPQSAFDPKSGKPVAAIYTVVLPRDPGHLSVPQGHGFGVATVKPDGSVRWVGVLGEGTAFSQSGLISKTGEWPVHALLYKNRGVLSGRLSFREMTGLGDLDGTLDWFKSPIPGEKTTYPGGFTRRIAAIGSRYEKAQAFPNGTLIFGEGNLAVVLAPVPVVNLAGRFQADPAVPGFDLKPTPATGLFKGTVPAGAASKPIKFQGVIFQRTGRGYGVFTGAPSPEGGLTTGFVDFIGAP